MGLEGWMVWLESLSEDQVLDVVEGKVVERRNGSL